MPSLPGALALGWVLGCAAQLQQAQLWSSWSYPALSGAAVLVGLPVLRSRAVMRGLLALGISLTLAFSTTGWRATVRGQQALPPALEGRDLLLSGRIDGLPQATEGGQRFEFVVASARGGAGEALPAPVARWLAGGGLRRVQLQWWGAAVGADLTVRTSPVLRAGDRWLILVRLKAPHGLANPWGSDAELAAWAREVQAWGSVRQGPQDPPPRWLGPAPAWEGGAGIDRLRQGVRDALLTQVADRRAAGVLAALVVGDPGAVLPADWALLRASGIAHLVSISGLHVTVFAWGAGLLVAGLWRRSPWLCAVWPAPHAAALGGLLLATAYVAFSGGGVPAQRTLGMLAGVSLLRLWGLRWPWPVTWVGVAAAVSAWDPWALLQPGFWLSFLAVGVLMAGGPAPASRDWRSRLQALLREQRVVTLALAPLTLLLFGQVALAGLLANLVAIPWMTGIVLPLALGGALWPALWQPAAWALQALFTPLQLLVAWPAAVLSLPAVPLPLAAAALLGGLLAVLRLPPALRLAGAPLLLPLLLWRPPLPEPGRFELLAADVGQGQAVLVRTAGHALLYDAGPRWAEELDAGQRVLVPLLRALGVRLDMLVVSHPDSDHAGGAASVLADQPGARLLASLPDGHALAAQRPPAPCLAGQRWDWDGVRFEVLHPREEDLRRDLALRHPNAHSCVLRITAAGGVSALLVGDLEAPQEQRLVGEGLAPADFLLVPHHGSRTSSTEAWLDAVRPRLALVQAGYRNRYGHPAPQVMARYEARGIPVVETTACGAARWESGSPDRVDCHRDQDPHYWQHRLRAGGPDIAILNSEESYR